MAYTPKLNHIAGACALLFCINSQTFAQSETQLSPVVVTGEKGTGYIAKKASIASVTGSDEFDLQSLPGTVNVISKDLLDDRQARVMSEAAKLDASIGDHYAPVGYYENLYIRGFPLDPATSYRINGMSATGEQNFAFENKERLEILKGTSAMQGGASTPGGLINFVTKRSKEVQSYTVGLGDRGGSYAAVDYGTFLNKEKTLGIRLNAAKEELRPYVKQAKGQREFFSLASDAKISQQTQVKFDFEYQNRTQRSVPALSLLGSQVPTGISPDINLSHYPWVQPTEIRSKFMGLQVDHQIHDSLQLFASVSRSEARINDRVAFPFGCESVTFCANGDFNVYDFRSDGEIRRNDEVKTGLKGKVNGFGYKHHWTVAVSEVRRDVRRGASIYGEPNNGPIYNNGVDNIYRLNASVPASSASLGPVHKILDSNQTSLLLHDIIEVNDKLKLFLGNRILQIDQRAYSVYDGSQMSSLKNTWHLPQIGASYKINSKLTNYVSFNRGLELGTIPLPDSFQNTAILPPRKTQQIEVGTKYAASSDSLFTLSIFRMERPNEFAHSFGVIEANKSTLSQEGKVTHTGTEASWAYKATKRLNLLASAMYLEATQSGATPRQGENFNSSQAVGVPKWRGVLFADYLVPNYEQLSLQGGWTYVSSKPVTLDNSVSVPGYHKFDAGLKYLDKVGKSKATYRLFVENVFDKFYWRDTSQTYGSYALYPGAPRIVRATATFDF
jgi:iron complex outermembrane receptor protein